VHESREQGERGVAVEHVVRIARRYVLVGHREGRDLKVRVMLKSSRAERVISGRF